MAYVIKSENPSASYHSALARAPWDRQRDTYILARKGVASCRRLWNDFSAEAPHLARLVAADVESDRRESAKVTKGVDKILGKAEKPGKAKLTKAEKAAIRAQRPLTSGKPDLMKGLQPDQVAKVVTDVMVRIVASSDNPFEREAARKLLGQ